mgnify:FL=1|tara:strand:- start:19650 stop:20189 length:540 start_codon:yes stop_codon:yes gene_type:complete
MGPQNKTDNTREFIPINFGVLTVSDSRSLQNDKSGDILVSKINESGHTLKKRQLVSDEIDSIKAVLNDWTLDKNIDVILGTGGTGVTGRDVTPEAFEQVFEKTIPGFGELFRMISYDLIGTSTIQSRTTAGVKNSTYLFALPGSPGACRDAWDNILQYQLDNRTRPCNLVELLPRLKEK